MNRMEEAINGLSEEELDLMNSDPQMLADFKAKYSGDQSIGDAVMAAGKRMLPSRETLEAPMKASEHLGKMVEAGGSGIAELDKAILPRMANAVIPGLQMETPAFQPTLAQASKNVEDVMADKTPDTGAGRAGKFIGSFFTPNQIALTATGEAAAKPIVKGLGYGINKIGSLLAPASEEALPGAAKAVGNALSTVSGVGTPELETVMAHGKDAVDAAKTFPQLAEDVAGSMNKLTTHLDDLEKAANAALNAEKTVNASVLTDAINSEIKSINMAEVTTPEMDSAKKILEGMLEKVKNKGTLTEPEVAKWVKQVQSKVNWNNPLGTETNGALTRIQSAVNDALKSQNPKYGEAMESFSNMVNLKNDLTQAMGLSKEGGFTGKFMPENVSVTKLKGLLNPDSAIQTKKMLGQFATVPGVPNYVSLAKEAAAKAALGTGFRSRLAGFMAGLVPGVGKAANAAGMAGGTALPSAGNAVYQGLTQ